MSRNNRDRTDPNNRVVHITNRCWKGLPFVPNHFMRRTINAVIAMAQTRHPVQITCYLFMGNHYHMIIAGDANRVSDFANYMDGEISKRMMRLMPGFWGPQFWCGRFKETHLSTVEDVINKIIYTFCNPLKGRLVSELSEYEGASSIAALADPDYRTRHLHSFTYPKHFKALKNSSISKKSDFELSKDLQEKSACFCELRTDLLAWQRCFKEKREITEIYARITSNIASAEVTAKSLGVIGAKRLRYQDLNAPHRPKKKKGDRTPFVECSDKETRLLHIIRYKSLRARSREAWNLVKAGIAAEWPRGTFVPSRRWIPLIQAQGT